MGANAMHASGKPLLVLMSKSDPFSYNALAELLVKMRPEVAMPPDDTLETLQVSLPGVASIWLEEALQDARVDTLRLAVDLDDTLLHNSYTCPSLWDLGGYYGADILPGYRYGRLSRSAIGWLRALRKRPAYDQISRSRHPFMESPRVIVAPNLPVLQMLQVLKYHGATLVLATASARARVDLLFARLPILGDLFGGAVFAAEDLAWRALEVEKGPQSDPLWEISAPVHHARPRSLMTKTPWTLAPAFDGAGYDILIDDSRITAQLFTDHGLADRLLAVDPHALTPQAAWCTVSDCLARLSGRPPPPLPKDLAEDTPVLRFEDPLYWPYMHIKDRF